MVHVVVGQSGDGEMAIEWNVRAFLNQTQAIALAATLNRWCKDNGVASDDEPIGWSAEEVEAMGTPPDDIDFTQVGCTGTLYSVVEIPLG